jgi:putative FmdB family regulatory protein
MPIYEYRCAACGFEKEVMQRMSDAQLTDCPECGKRTFSKLVSAAGFQLKGSGWYATDFKNSGAKPKKEEAKKDEVKKDSPAETKKDAAPKSDGGSGSTGSASTKAAGATPAP